MTIALDSRQAKTRAGDKGSGKWALIYTEPLEV